MHLRCLASGPARSAWRPVGSVALSNQTRALSRSFATVFVPMSSTVMPGSSCPSASRIERRKACGLTRAHSALSTLTHSASQREEGGVRPVALSADDQVCDDDAALGRVPLGDPVLGRLVARRVQDELRQRGSGSDSAAEMPATVSRYARGGGRRRASCTMLAGEWQGWRRRRVVYLRRASCVPASHSQVVSTISPDSTPACASVSRKQPSWPAAWMSRRLATCSGDLV